MYDNCNRFGKSSETTHYQYLYSNWTNKFSNKAVQLFILNLVWAVYEDDVYLNVRGANQSR